MRPLLLDVPPKSRPRQPFPRLSLAAPASSSLAVGLEEIRRDFPDRFTSAAKAPAIRFQALAERQRRFEIRLHGGEILVSYSRLTEAFRALGIIMGRLEAGLPLEPFEQSAAFESLGAMIDVSRNGVLRPEAVRRLIRHLALMGFDRLMLYTEDTYEVPGEPLIGYFRGGYTQEELTELDSYAARFGVEIVPCIQTLGHLEQILQWPPYHHLQDTPSVILADEPRAEALLERMIEAASAPFRSRRIHIGMDEAHGIGTGRYRLQHGLRPPFEILCSHLERTVAICRRLQLQPMIWSDMFFRLGSKSNHYYDRDSEIAPEVAARVPQDVDLVYWDYYHTDRGFYDEWIARHRAMGKEPVFAGGIWTWNRWWAQLPHSYATLRAGMDAARANGLREAFVTLWGDDGMECDVFSALPALQFFAELGYGDEGSAEDCVPIHLLGSADASAASWITSSDLDLVPDQGDTPFEHANPSKWLLWHDPLLGFLDRHVLPSFPDHYAKLAGRCAQWQTVRPGDARLSMVEKVATALALKTALHLSLRPAYLAGDRNTLDNLLHCTLPALVSAVGSLRALHAQRWAEIYRPFGWEVLEHRYAGLLSRLDTLKAKLAAHLGPGATPIEELACPSHVVWPNGHLLSTTLSHRQAASPSRVF
jgi:hexosaminidase